MGVLPCVCWHGNLASSAWRQCRRHAQRNKWGPTVLFDRMCALSAEGQAAGRGRRAVKGCHAQRYASGRKKTHTNKKGGRAQKTTATERNHNEPAATHGLLPLPLLPLHHSTRSARPLRPLGPDAAAGRSSSACKSAVNLSTGRCTCNRSSGGEACLAGRTGGAPREPAQRHPPPPPPPPLPPVAPSRLSAPPAPHTHAASQHAQREAIAPRRRLVLLEQRLQLGNVPV